jgi:hypothetical protein
VFPETLESEFPGNGKQPTKNPAEAGVFVWWRWNGQNPIKPLTLIQ